MVIANAAMSPEKLLFPELFAPTSREPVTSSLLPFPKASHVPVVVRSVVVPSERSMLLILNRLPKLSVSLVLPPLYSRYMAVH